MSRAPVTSPFDHAESTSRSSRMGCTRGARSKRVRCRGRDRDAEVRSSMAFWQVRRHVQRGDRRRWMLAVPPPKKVEREQPESRQPPQRRRRLVGDDCAGERRSLPPSRVAAQRWVSRPDRTTRGEIDSHRPLAIRCRMDDRLNPRASACCLPRTPCCAAACRRARCSMSNVPILRAPAGQPGALRCAGARALTPGSGWGRVRPRNGGRKGRTCGEAIPRGRGLRRSWQRPLPAPAGGWRGSRWRGSPSRTG